MLRLVLYLGHKSVICRQGGKKSESRHTGRRASERYPVYGLLGIRNYYLTRCFSCEMISIMRTESLVEARRAAEAAVKDMSDGPLKVAAFQTILTRLLDQEAGPINSAGDRPAKKRTVRAAVVGSGTTARLLALLEEGFFAQQRSLAQIRAVLAERGWHYRLEDLGTPVTRLVRRRVLRRTQVLDGGKKIWWYSAY